jgi:hypothetical protein
MKKSAMPANDFMIHPLKVASDCKEMENDISAIAYERYNNIIREICDHLWTFAHKCRNSNTKSQNPTKFAISTNQERHIWSLAPVDEYLFPNKHFTRAIKPIRFS